MKVLHAIVAVFTALLFFIQHKYVSVCTGPFSSKQPVPAWSHSSGDSTDAALAQLAADSVVCAGATRHHEERERPKYKRDPEIAVDNECIGYHPHDYD